jgi:AcrR family transcriptional regulator
MTGAVDGGPVNGERWTKILEAAADEFDEQGFKAARLKDIAARVQIVPGGLYYYIKSKEDLLFAVIETTARKGLDSIVEGPELHGAPAPVRLHAFVLRYVEMLDESRTSSLRAVYHDLKHLTPAHYAQIKPMQDEIRGFARGIIEQCVTEGVVDSATDLDVAVHVLFEFLNTKRSWTRASGYFPLPYLADQYTASFLDGFKARRDDEVEYGQITGARA